MSDGGVLLDSSAVLAVLFDEPGADRVEEVLPLAAISAVNLAEVVAKLHDRGVSEDDIAATLRDLDLSVVPFDEAIAVQSGRLRPLTRGLGMSLGDRACLATAQQGQFRVLTADRAWAGAELGLSLDVVR